MSYLVACAARLVSRTQSWSTPCKSALRFALACAALGIVSCAKPQVGSDASVVATRPAAVSVTPGTTLGGTATGSTFPAFGDQRLASVDAFDTNNALVVYIDSATYDPTLSFVRVNRTGARLSMPKTLATGVSMVRPAVACYYSACGVVYAAGGRVLFVKVGTAGEIYDNPAIDVGPAPAPIMLAVSSDGTGIFDVGWTDRGTVGSSTYSVRERRQGVVTSGSTTLASGVSGGGGVSVGSFGDTGLVVWEDGTGTASRIRGRRVDFFGAPLDAGASTISDVGGIRDDLPRLVRRNSDLVLVHRMNLSLQYLPIQIEPSLTIGTRVSLGSPYDPITGLEASSESDLVYYAYVTTAYGDKPRLHAGSINGGFTSTWGNGFDSLSSFSILTMQLTPLMVTSANMTSIASQAQTSGYDVQTSADMSTFQNLTLGASSAKEPMVAYVPPGQFGVLYAEDDVHANRRVSLHRRAASGIPVDSGVNVAVGSSTSSLLERFEHARLARLGSGYQLLWRRTSATPGTTSVGFQMQTADTLASPTLGPVLSAPSVTAPATLLGGVSQTTLFAVTANTLEGYTLTASTSTPGPFVSTNAFPSVFGSGSRAIAWSLSSMMILTPSTTTAASVPMTNADDLGFDVAAGSRSTLVVHRNAATGTATEIRAILLDAAGTTVPKTEFVVDSGAGLVGPPRVAFDGTNYDLVFVRGTNVYVRRVDEDGTLLESMASPLAANATGPARVPSIASDGAGRVFVAWETFDATDNVRAMRIATTRLDWSSSAGGIADGGACTSALQCGSGFCVDGVCCDTSCNAGATNDCAACSVAAGAAVDGVCGLVTNPFSRTCRPPAGPCDVAEVCVAGSAVCPSDTLLNGTLCGATGSTPCQLDQRCTGTSVACPPLAPAPPTTPCRVAAAPCDAVEYCDGTTINCPADGIATTAAICRPAADACDEPDHCDGVTTACPPDVHSPPTKVCRPSASGCDADDYCDGSSIVCPADLPQLRYALCRPATLPCDVPEECDGVSFACPADDVALAGTVCRPAAGACDAPEFCDGVSAACLAPDVRRPVGTTCRAAVGPCDLAETCTAASGVQCPADTYRAFGTVCRAAAGLCDSAEACSGNAAHCPSDRQRVDGSGCADGLSCNGDEVCAAGQCVAGEPLVCAASTPCLEVTGECSVPERPSSCAVGVASTGSPSSALAFLVVCALAFARRASRAFRGLALAATLSMLGGCVCGVGSVSCDDACVDVGYDEQNCGACGVSCGYGQCIEGECRALASTSMSCTDDQQCLDANVCNGVERCIDGRCRAGETLTCDDGRTCTDDFCEPAAGSCVSKPTTSSCGLGL